MANTFPSPFNGPQAEQSTAFAQAPQQPPGVLSNAHLLGSARLFHSGGVPAIATTSGNDSTPVITEEYVAEVSVDRTSLVTCIWLFNGSAASGNTIATLRDALGNVIGASASTATSGTTAYQKFPLVPVAPFVGPIVLQPGTYYIGRQNDNTTTRYRSHIVGSFGAGKLTGQTYGTVVAAPMPVTFTTNLGTLGSLG